MTLILNFSCYNRKQNFFYLCNVSFLSNMGNYINKKDDKCTLNIGLYFEFLLLQLRAEFLLSFYYFTLILLMHFYVLDKIS